MTRAATAIALCSVLGVGAWVGLPGLAAQAGSTPCVISGATWPELMPEYLVWDVHLRSLVVAAQVDQHTGDNPPEDAPFDPAAVRNLAKQHGLSEAEITKALTIGRTAIIKLNALQKARAQEQEPKTDQEHLDRRLAEVDMILDARDEIIRSLFPAASRALRRSAPVKGSTFLVPVSR